LRAVDRKESLFVLFVFVAVILMFSLLSSRSPYVVTEAPDQQTILGDNDMVVPSFSGDIIVGKSTRDEVMKIFPEGKNLGRSGLYRPNNLDCLVTFSRNENVVVRMDIGPSDLATSRGIRANDSFDKVVEKYGSNYTKTYYKEKPQIFDAYYGSDQYILFKIENNIVKKILVGSPIS
jgi:hypothetical protein